MRTKWLSPALALLAAGMIAAPASAQTIAYTNFLSFDLQSFTSQATAGLFDDDIEMIADASKLTGVDGNRLFTSFSNLSDPAGFGDNILTYSIDHFGVPGDSDHFDTGSYLVGWMGKHDKDSEYTQSVFYQRNQGKTMFEDLQDGSIGTTGAGFDAEYTGSVTIQTHAGFDPAEVTSEATTNYNLKRYDERAAMDFDWGVARDLSEDLSVGGRLFFEKDQVNSYAEGTREIVNRADIDPLTAGTQLGVTSRSVVEYQGNGEEAFKYREMGVSFDSNYHAWEDQSVGFRVDIFGSALTNPGLGTVSPTRGSGQPTGPYYGGWERINLSTTTNYNRVAAGTASASGNNLAADHETRSWFTGGFSYGSYDVGRGGLPVETVDDKRDGIGFNAKGEYNREWAGGDVNSWVGFGHRGLNIDARATAVSRSGSSFWWNDGSTDYEATNSTEQTITATRSGDTSMNTMELGGRWTRDMNSNVSVGIGAILTRAAWTDDYEETLNSTMITGRFDDGAAGANALYDLSLNPTHDERSTVTVVDSTLSVKDETKNTFLRLPVATQFHFKKRWTFNMGAQHMILNTTRETNFDVPASGNGLTMQTVNSVLAGDPTVSYTSTQVDSRSTTITDRYRSNWTTYWYGLSVDITDAVQVDINGFLDTNSYDNVLDRGLPTPNLSGSGSITSVDFFRNLAISMKYIFW